MIDIETLRVIWWLLLGILLIGFAVTDGFDMGAAMLSPFVARNDVERRIVLNTMGPFWEGNQVWIILGAGAIFAAWPAVYALAFSGFYLLILLLLLTMGIMRAVSFKYRSKLANHGWRSFWDRIVVIGGFVPALLFGMLIGNTLQGVPFYYDDTLRLFYTGSLSELLNPFAFLCGATSIAMLAMHGGLYLAVKTNDPIRSRAIRAARVSALWLIVLFAIGGVWVSQIMGYTVLTGADPQGYSNPLNKNVGLQLGAWIQNYKLYPFTMIVPAVGFLGAFLALFTAGMGNSRLAFIGSGLSIAGVIGTVGISMFPFIVPSSSHMPSSLLVWDASSSQLTLLVMLAAVIIFLPCILLYTAWVYRALRGKVTQTLINTDKQAY